MQEYLKSKKILIYGTGKIAEKLIKTLKDFQIVGVIDRIQFEGEFSGVPIRIWDEISKDTADIIIIASLQKNYKVIFERIQYHCVALNIVIYGENGQNLSKEYQFKYLDSVQAAYFCKNKQELLDKIDQYDAISFDLFDTLIMRKVLEPVDVFDLVEDNIRHKGIEIPGFKKKRRTAEIQANGRDIYCIYHVLEKIWGIDKETSQIIMEEELACEKKCLIPRVSMVEVMNYAVKQKKKVNIISDMYLPSTILKNLLEEMGIKGYDKLYVSCEYGVGKGTGIFEIYRQHVGNVRCLHIGDNMQADIIMPKRYGIDSYEVKSAYEMMKISSLQKLLICSGNIDNNTVLGIMLSEIFNDPFTLHHTLGIVPIKTPEIFAKLFIMPVVLIYMQTLIELVQKGEYEAILFTARDCYLFKKIYDSCFLNEISIPGIYFLTSRKLCLMSTLESEQDMIDLCQHFPTSLSLKKFLEEFLQEDILLKEKEANNNILEIFCFYADKVKQSSSIVRENYLKYIKNLLKDTSKKYLFCELSSKGTIHKALNRILSINLDGMYLYWRGNSIENKLNKYSIYGEDGINNIDYKRDLLEVILTSPLPSVQTMDENGMPVYSLENRTKKELQMIEKAQNAIIESVQQYIELRGVDKIIGSDLPEIVLGLCEYVKYKDEAEAFIKQKNVDDINQRRICILDR